jgi:hypothetical protein
MQAVSGEEFFHWAMEHGVAVDPRYPDSRCFRLVPVAEHGRFWVLPADLATLPQFVMSLLDGFGGD